VGLKEKILSKLINLPIGRFGLGFQRFHINVTNHRSMKISMILIERNSCRVQVFLWYWDLNTGPWA
jgi:hypothetical protein